MLLHTFDINSYSTNLQNQSAKIVEIIGDYRKEDGIEIDQEHILRWVDQFDKDDREFLLSEFLHILPSSYLSRSDVIESIGTTLSEFAKRYNYSEVEDFLTDTYFIKCQKEIKSQTALLKLLDNFTTEKYSYSIFNKNLKTAKRLFYFDDVLASGGIFKSDIIQFIDKFGLDEFMKKELSIVCLFFFIHTWGFSNMKFSLQNKYNKHFVRTVKVFDFIRIENNPRINYYNPEPSFNHVYPKKNDIGEKLIEVLPDKIENLYDWRNKEFAFRSEGQPVEEVFYSSRQNRDRYEFIILNKCVELFNGIESIEVPSIRPLGFTNPSNCTLGTGSHAFTWRNISNTCPLVFWWAASGWYPLFPVQNRGQ